MAGGALAEVKEFYLHQLSNTQREQIEKLAYQLWEQRGRPLGSSDKDWLCAEQELMQRPDLPSRLPFSAIAMEPREY